MLHHQHFLNCRRRFTQAHTATTMEHRPSVALFPHGCLCRMSACVPSAPGRMRLVWLTCLVHRLANVGVSVRSACLCTLLYMYVFLQRGRSINEATAKQRHTAPFWTFQRSSSQVLGAVPFPVIPPPPGLEFWLDQSSVDIWRTEADAPGRKKNPHRRILYSPRSQQTISW